MLVFVLLYMLKIGRRCAQDSKFHWAASSYTAAELASG